jgi:signal transduction histidine kinase
VPPDALPHIFKRFWQAESGRTREHSGLGLGLALAKHLAELHGGSIEARSAGEGKGAEFLVKLPLRREEIATTERRQHEHDSVAVDAAVPRQRKST